MLQKKILLHYYQKCDYHLKNNLLWQKYLESLSVKENKQEL